MNMAVIIPPRIPSPPPRVFKICKGLFRKYDNWPKTKYRRAPIIEKIININKNLFS